MAVETALRKVRPSDEPSQTAEASIEAARNELEPFQIVIDILVPIVDHMHDKGESSQRTEYDPIRARTRPCEHDVQGRA